MLSFYRGMSIAKLLNVEYLDFFYFYSLLLVFSCLLNEKLEQWTCAAAAAATAATPMNGKWMLRCAMFL